MGLKLSTLTEDLAQQYGLTDQKTGALVTGVEPRSPAAREGVRPGDLITRVGNEKVDNAQQASDALAKADLSKGVRFYITNKEGSRFVFVKKK
jgi:S1-C subfamily serine protease